MEGITSQLLDRLEYLLSPETEEAAHTEELVQDILRSVTKAKKIVAQYEDNPGLKDDPAQVDKDLFAVSASLVKIDHLMGIWQGRASDRLIKETLKIVASKIEVRIRKGDIPLPEGIKLTTSIMDALVHAHPDYERAVSLISQARTRAGALTGASEALHEFVWNLRKQAKGFVDFKRQGRLE